MTLKNDKFIFSHLAWDTDYFGHKSGKLVLIEEINETELSKIKELSEGYTFITVTNQNNNAANNILIGKKTTAFLTDVNMQFSKDLSLYPNKNLVDKQIMVKEAMEFNDKILNIAEKAFVYSRFLNDSNLPIKKSEQIYENWLKNAFNKAGKFFIIFQEEEKIIGFVLFSLNESIAVIELIAVDPLSASKGVGKRMINYLFSYLTLGNINRLNVGTQVDNLIAQNFYNSCGFRLIACHSIYHWWRSEQG